MCNGEATSTYNIKVHLRFSFKYTSWRSFGFINHSRSLYWAFHRQGIFVIWQLPREFSSIKLTSWQMIGWWIYDISHRHLLLAFVWYWNILFSCTLTWHRCNHVFPSQICSYGHYRDVSWNSTFHFMNCWILSVSLNIHKSSQLLEKLRCWRLLCGAPRFSVTPVWCDCLWTTEPVWDSSIVPQRCIRGLVDSG